MRMLAHQWRDVWVWPLYFIIHPLPSPCLLLYLHLSQSRFWSRYLDLSRISSDAIPSQLWNFLWDQVLKRRNELFSEAFSVHTAGFRTACRSKSCHLTVMSVSEENNLDGTWFQIGTCACGCMCWCGGQTALYPVVIYTVSGAFS